MKTFLAYLQALLLAVNLVFAQPAWAQSFPKPPDVAAFTQVTPNYKTDGTNNYPIDSTVTPMPIGSGLTNIPVPSTSGRIATIGPYDGTAAPYCLTLPFGGTCQENKFRTLTDYSHTNAVDPIRNYGEAPGSSHCHTFFGNSHTNQFSTYASNRNHSGDAHAAGSGVNGTDYWFPCIEVLNPYGDGKNFAIKPDSITTYYTENPATDGTGYGAKAFIPVGLRYVFGFDMDSSSPSTQFAWLQSILDAKNATIGHTRYQMTNPSTGRRASQALYNCVGATPASVTVLVNADGSDPYGGTCASGAEFNINISGNSCYDGTNLWSPGGYKHVIPAVWDNDANRFVCPFNYYKIVTLTLEIHVHQYGWTDRQRWVLSSDLAYRSAHGLDATQVPAGTTFHTDWFDGWDHVNGMNVWQSNLSGVEHGTGHEGDSSQIDSGHYLVGGYTNECGDAPSGGRCPVIDFTVEDRTTESGRGWVQLPPSWTANTVNMHMHH
jgi:hypothetical protein